MIPAAGNTEHISRTSAAEDISGIIEIVIGVIRSLWDIPPVKSF